ncbi:hypothetical protein [Sphingomonas sp. TWP1-3-1]|uniref:hypothetical protein n=1 Tax=Sphingomonas sp. TWP1-3-1 TaxID=2804612 RepID=UPI003CECF77F
MRTRHVIPALIGLGIGSTALAQTPAPTDEIKAVFAKGNLAILCSPADALRPGPLLGELGSAYKLNLFALPAAPQVAGVSVPDTVEARAAAWIVSRQRSDVEDQGLTETQREALEQVGTDLTDYVVWLARSKKQPFSNAPGTSVPDLRSATGDDRARLRADLLAQIFAPLLTPAATTAPVLNCVPRPEPRPNPHPDDEGEPGQGLVFAVRGKSDDLAVPRNEPGTTKPGAAFKGASAASIAFTDNHQKGETSVAIDATVGVGHQIGRSDALFAFVRYVQTTTETDAAGDDDDKKDIRALSPGVLYRHNFGLAGVLYGTLGATAFPTFDFAQHARTGRVRLFIDDISVSGVSRGPLCGRSDRIAGGIEIACRAGVFTEGAHVWRAGTSEDLASLEDDEYLGVGGSLRLGLSLPEVSLLKPFSLVGEYRYMAIVSGRLSDPHRLSVALNYKLVDENLSFGIGYDEGSNFDTFQRERITKVTLGFKY